MSYSRLAILLLVFITLVAYLPVSRHAFLQYDDNDYVTKNRIVQNGLTLAGVEWAFTTGYASNWHPVTWLSHMTDCELFKFNAGAHHFINVLFHSANTALLFLLLFRLTGKIWPPALVAALFAWHPLHVESVAWIAERKDVLSTFFGLLTMLSYVKFVREKSRRHFWIALFYFALGLMSKPMLVTLPFLLLLLDFWPLGRLASFKPKVVGRPAPTINYQPSIINRLLLEKLPFFLLALASCVVTFAVQSHGRSVDSLEQVSLLHRLANAPVATGGYLLKMFWPARLAVIYPLAPIPPAVFALALVALLLISAAAWRWRADRPYFLAGWLWFLVSLVPVIGLVQVGSAAMADRYTYLPSIGIFIALAFGLQELSDRFHWPEKALPILSCFMAGICLVLMEGQLQHWRDSETLFRQAVAVTENNQIAHGNLGLALELQGRPAEALAEYSEAVAINPNRYQLHFSIGNVLQKLGRPDAALAEYRQFLAQEPDNAELHNAAGGALAALEKWDAARDEFAEAMRLDTNYAMPHIGLAQLYFRQGRPTNAVGELWLAVHAEPYNPDTLAAAACPLAANQNDAARDADGALVLALKANELSHGLQPRVLDVLGMAFANNGDFTNAAASVTAALELAEAADRRDTNLLRLRLDLYQNHRPWREAFTSTNVPAFN